MGAGNCTQRFLSGAIRAYQIIISPFLGTNCRFAPSCSEYCREAVSTHGVARGLWLGAKRLCRCHPWGGAGFDPVPPPSPIAHKQ